MLRNRFLLLAAAAALFLSGYGAMQIALGGGDTDTTLSSSAAQQDPPNSEANTASQKTFENSRKLVDVVNDNPVSLPSVKHIAPPSTGNGGLVDPPGESRLPQVALGALALVIVAYARTSTAPRRRH